MSGVVAPYTACSASPADDVLIHMEYGARVGALYPTLAADAGALPNYATLAAVTPRPAMPLCALSVDGSFTDEDALYAAGIIDEDVLQLVADQMETDMAVVDDQVVWTANAVQEFITNASSGALPLPSRLASGGYEVQADGDHLRHDEICWTFTTSDGDCLTSFEQVNAHFAAAAIFKRLTLARAGEYIVHKEALPGGYYLSVRPKNNALQMGGYGIRLEVGRWGCQTGRC